ncbi:MAG: hypothetical protein CVV61_04625 [Tenericutes bacterium HGW-Tenericutes-6]|jgi:hypothetical protein|nr:MAG: hypothetical protein CVV61_04625 [Tenericutes bacterium HGW-Tenericutes-6]
MKRILSKKLISFLLIMFMLASFSTSFAFWASAILNATSTGDGSVPIGTWPPPGSISVSNATDFNNIRNNLSATFFITDDIVLTGNFTPIGSETQPFTGVIMGNGKKITGLNLTTPVVTGTNEYLGLFAVNDGVIKDLSIVSASLTYNVSESGSAITKTIYTGIVAASNTGTIHNVYVSGSLSYNYQLSISGNNSTNNHIGYIGGMSGSTADQITDSHSNVAITAYAEMVSTGNGIKQNIDLHVGGLSGIITSGFVLNTYAEGNVTATSFVSRRNNGSSPSNNVNIHIGGLIGTNESTLSNSFAAGNITSSISIGNQATNTTNNIRYGGLVGLGSSTSSYRRSTQTLNITSGPVLTLNSTGTATTEANLKLSTWVYNSSNLAWDSNVWSTDGTNYPRLINNTY